MIGSIAFCPHPPVLVPQIGVGAAEEFTPLRTACTAAVRRLAVTRPQQWLVLGADGPPIALRDYAPGAPDLPDPFGGSRRALPLTLGGWLLDQVAAGVPGPAPARHFAGVDAGGIPVEPLPDLAPVTALLVMGDGSARRGVKAPGYLDARAEPFDAAVLAAIAAADPEGVATLAELDVVLAAQLLVGGVGPWRAAARLAGDGPWRSDVLYADASAGVQYVVAVWERT